MSEYVKPFVHIEINDQGALDIKSDGWEDMIELLTVLSAAISVIQQELIKTSQSQIIRPATNTIHDRKRWNTRGGH